ncbi:MAG TPA: hypothetical protein VM686_02750 [Polyangiaceae bacterium]|nr:hypothetical protein [Polyangiaceae bacterium]
MSFWRSFRLILAALCAAPAASAATPPSWDKPPPRAVPAHIPPAARGFQAALRSGFSLPWGKASEEPGDELSARSGWQVPVILDAGFKLNKPVFLGLYLGFGYGSGRAEACDAEGFDCRVLSYQFGVQGQYQFGASEAINPWIGYGIGYEILEQSISTEGYDETEISHGMTFAKLGLGADLRGVFGLGPFVEVSAGRFAASSTSVDETEVHEGPVDESAWHGMLSFGVRLVVLP